MLCTDLWFQVSSSSLTYKDGPRNVNKVPKTESAGKTAN